MKSIASIVLISSLLLSVSCSNSKEIKNDETMEVKDTDSFLLLSAADFYANGENDTWKLLIRFGGKIIFTDVENNIVFAAKSNKKIVARGVNIVQIHSENETHSIQVSIDVAECMKTGKKVNVVIKKLNERKNMEYEGCGYYRGTPQLHDIWALHTLNGREITPEQFPRELPHFEFNLVTQKMSGFAGCNQVNGSLRFEYNKMIIDQLLSTRMYCGEASDLENEILTILRGKPIYHLKDLHLILETTKGSLTLKKVD